MMNKTIKNFLLLAIIAAYFYLGVLWERHSEYLPYIGNHKKKDPVKKITNFINYLNTYYVEDINLDTLVENVIIKTLEELDPYTRYIPKQNKQRMKEIFQGNYVGIGVNFYIESDTVTVIRVLENSPSERNGILPGDRILIADSDTLYNKKMSSKNIAQKIKGNPNTNISLKIYRKYLDTLLNFNLKRKEIPIKSITASYMLTESIGYIRLNSFTETSYEEFKNTLDKLQNQKMEKLILDLRDNPGGYAHIARKIIDEFLEDEKIIMITENNKGKITKNRATSKGNFENQPLVVLVSENSASASELLAGAIQDNDRGYIIGNRTFGKGLIQQQMDIGYGDAILLTTARYYTPSGRFIQKPYKDKSTKYAQNINNKKIDSFKYTTLKGRPVYGGGGIVPDVFIKNDKESIWTQAPISNFMNYFVFRLLDENREKYVFENADNFIAKPLKNSSLIIKNFEKYCKENGINYKINKQKKEAFLNNIKAYIGLQLFNEEVYLKILNVTDPFIKKAIEKINQEPFVVE